MINAFTIDVEEHFHAANLRISPRRWDTLPSRVVRNTERILSLLDRYQTRCTCFILGWVAHKYPGLVRSIHRAGHEIGSHSFWHRHIYDMTEDEFRQDLRLSMSVLADITGEPVRLFRAPTFSITRRSLWALEVLAQEGITIDSSIFPVYHDRYGIPHAPPHPFRISTNDGVVTEVPPGVYRIRRWNFPIGGGGYFRLLPGFFTGHLIERVNGHQRRPVVFYIHPWEVDPHHPCETVNPLMRWRQRQGLGRCYPRLARLLARARFGSLSDSLASIRTPAPRLTLSELYGHAPPTGSR